MSSFSLALWTFSCLLNHVMWKNSKERFPLVFFAVFAESLYVIQCDCYCRTSSLISLCLSHCLRLSECLCVMRTSWRITSSSASRVWPCGEWSLISPSTLMSAWSTHLLWVCVCVCVELGNAQQPQHMIYSLIYQLIEGADIEIKAHC